MTPGPTPWKPGDGGRDPHAFAVYGTVPVWIGGPGRHTFKIVGRGSGAQSTAIDDVRVAKELKAKGIERIRWDDAEMHKVRDLAHKTWEDWSKKGPLAKKAFDSQVAWLKDLGLIA